MHERQTLDARTVANGSASLTRASAAASPANALGSDPNRDVRRDHFVIAELVTGPR